MLKSGEKIVGLQYERDGKIYQAWPASPETLTRWQKDGVISDTTGGTCSCGSNDFCDLYTHRRVRCFEDAAGVCNWHETNDYCDNEFTVESKQFVIAGESESEFGAGCAGNACSVASVTYNPAEDNYIVANNSPNKRIRITLRNFSISQNFDLNPGESKGSFIRNSYITPYDANYI